MIHKKTYINNQIRAREVRVIDEKGSQVGIILIEEALKMSREKGLDLIQITDKVIPPICKIMDHGKFLYDQKKKDKSAKSKKEEIKGIRLSFNISDHDLEIRANAAKKFLEKGNKIKAEMRLKGRQKGLKDFAKEKTRKFIKILENIIPIKIDRDIKIEPRGITVVISHDNKKNES